MFSHLRKLGRFYSDREFKALFILLAITLIVGMVFYHNIEHWSLFNSFFFSATVSIAGYGQFIPHTVAGKLFTIFYIVFELGLILAFINAAAKLTIKRYVKIIESYIDHTEEYFEHVVENALQKKKNN
jgi:hypothetical protein